jgi:hypothetical protein
MQPNELLKKWRESGREALAANLTPETINAEQRTVDVVWFTGADIARYNWWTDERYILRFDPKGADLSLLNNGAPVLDNHSTWEGAAGQKGKVEKAWVDEGLYKGTLRFSKRPEVEGLWTDIQDKIVTKFSMGVELLETVDERDKAGRLMTRTATKWRPFELSIAPIPADFGTTTLSADRTPAQASLPLDGDDAAEDEAVRATAQITEEEVPTMPEQTANTGGEARTELNAEALRAEGARIERERLAAIDRTAAPFLKRGEIDSAFVQRFKDEGKSVEDLKAAILEALAARSDANPIQNQQPTGTVTEDSRDKRREAMTAAVMHRYNSSTKLDGEAREYRGMSLLRLAEECLNNAGVKTRGMAPMELATRALTFGQQFVGIGPDGIEQLGAMATSDFPFILANVANKTLRAAYESQPSTWRPFCRQSNARDFKAKFVNQLGDAPSLELVPEGHEFPFGAIPEARESYNIATYGKILPFTRQALINDDMGAFTRLQELQGRAAARREADIVWGLITGNPQMGDGVNLFSVANHANLVTGPGTVINVDNLGITRQLMRIQRGLVNADGSAEMLNLTPKFLLVPTTREQVALQYTSAAFQAIATSGTTSGINPWASSLTPIVEARLDATAAIGLTAWYLVADPAQIDTIEYAYLEGQEGVYLETRMGFTVDGIEFKSRLDFGAKVIDWRAFVRNDGA